MSVPVGRRNLFAERRRAILGIAGVATPLMLVLALNAIFAGAMAQVTRPIDQSPADVFVAQAGVRSMHMVYSAIPAPAVEAIRAIDGVAWADPVLRDLAEIIGPSGERNIAYLFGYQPGHRGGPVRLVSGRAPGPGEIVLDTQAAKRLGVGVGSTVQSLGVRWRVSGMTSGLTAIANTVAYVRFDEFAKARGIKGTVSYILVGARGSPEALARRITAATGLSALTRAAFAAEERKSVQDMTTDLMRIMTLVALAIGLAVISLTLYATTLSRLREIGVMKAIGSRTRTLAGTVVSQAAWTVGLAVALAVPATVLLGWGAGRSGAIAMMVEPSSVIQAASGAALLGAVGAIVPLIRVARVDPATVFRR